MSNKIDLIRPTLQTVRTHQVGRFHDLSQPKGIRSIKSLTLPMWLKDGQYKQFSIDEQVVEFLQNDGTKSTRHRTKRPKWVPKRNGRGGHYLCHVRTPDGRTQWVNGKLARERFNRRAGRKESGMAYKIRREVWRVLARAEDDRRLLEDDTVWKKSKKQRQCKTVSCRVVDLSLALHEYLSVALFKNGIIVNRRFALLWFRELKGSFEPGLDDDEAIVWIQLNPDRYLTTICNERWGAVLSRLVETAVHQRRHQSKYGSKDSYQKKTTHEKVGFIENQDSVSEEFGEYDLVYDSPLLDAAFHQRQYKSSNGKENATRKVAMHEHVDFIEIQDGECEGCGGYDWVYDPSKGEVSCGKCGLVTREIEMDGQEHYFFQTKQGSD